MLKADFHVHTLYSKCSDMNPRDLIKDALNKGYDILGVVDHNSIKGGIAAKKFAGKKILVIPGEEIMTNYGELIVFFSDGKYGNDLTDVCDRASDMNHFIVVPHPFDYLRKGIKNNIIRVKKMSAIEVFNSRVLLNRFNSIAKSYAEKNKIPQIVGSDAHFTEEIGNASVFLDCDKSTDSVFDFIRKNKVTYNCRKCSIYSHFKTNVELPIKRLF